MKNMCMLHVTRYEETMNRAVEVCFSALSKEMWRMIARSKNMQDATGMPTEHHRPESGLDRTVLL